MGVEFGELPPIRKKPPGKRGLWVGHEDDADALRRKPGVWGRIVVAGTRDQAARPAGLVNNGEASGFAPDHDGHFEAVTRANPDKQSAYDLWAVYVPTGPKDKGEAPPAPKRLSPKRA